MTDVFLGSRTIRPRGREGLGGGAGDPIDDADEPRIVAGPGGRVDELHISGQERLPESSVVCA